MKLKITLLSVLFVIAQIPQITAQTRLITSRKEALAVQKQTRQEDGKPGKNYWQNTSDYNIKASVDVQHKTLKGNEHITYYNNSPDSLSTIVVRLYQDLFKKGANRNSMVPVDPRDVTDGVNITGLAINDSKVDLSSNKSGIRRTGTLMLVRLPEKLAPNSKLNLQIAWNFHIPEHSLIRMGTLDSTSLFIGQWYPQIAVYDDINGWDTRSYNGMAEFYSDFARFHVAITVPEKFMVWATGEPVNLKEVLQPDIYRKYKEAAVSDKVIHVITEEDLKKGDITTGQHTWVFKADRVSDFAFGISDHYLWDVTSAVVDKATKRRTVIGAAYNKKADNFDKVAEISRRTIESLSDDMPGIPYPFPYLTVYNGDFGMEYPMITNVGAEKSYAMTVYANSHEITHAYFPFYVGTNETKNGWMDEGLTVFLPEKIQTQLDSTLNIPVRNTSVFSAYSGIDGEPALMTPSYYLDPRIYFYLNYGKTEQALRMLQIELGNDVFKKCLLAFMDRWKYKHPTPIDYFNTFNDVSGQNLNWYWKAWYYQDGGMPDLAIAKVDKKGNTLNVTIENKGDIPIPVVLSFYNKGRLVQTITRPARLWVKHNKIELSYASPENITWIQLGNNLIPDAFPKDNKYVVE